jgi:hypothetical protein
LWNGFKTGWDAIAFTTPGATLQSGVEISVPTQKLTHKYLKLTSSHHDMHDRIP